MHQLLRVVSCFPEAILTRKRNISREGGHHFRSRDQFELSVIPVSSAHHCRSSYVVPRAAGDNRCPYNARGLSLFAALAAANVPHEVTDDSQPSAGL